MIEMGIVVGVALLATLAKMNWRWKLRMFSNPLVVDVSVFIALCLIHWGTFSGVMVATIGALTCSLTLSAGRALYGHVEKGVYTPGYFDISSKLK
jgi:hypothetical protein